MSTRNFSPKQVRVQTPDGVSSDTLVVVVKVFYVAEHRDVTLGLRFASTRQKTLGLHPVAEYHRFSLVIPTTVYASIIEVLCAGTTFVC